jgi:hypothetical protein
MNYLPSPIPTSVTELLKDEKVRVRWLRYLLSKADEEILDRERTIRDIMAEG